MAQNRVPNGRFGERPAVGRPMSRENGPGLAPQVVQNGPPAGAPPAMPRDAPPDANRHPHIVVPGARIGKKYDVVDIRKNRMSEADAREKLSTYVVVRMQKKDPYGNKEPPTWANAEHIIATEISQAEAARKVHELKSFGRSVVDKTNELSPAIQAQLTEAIDNLQQTERDPRYYYELAQLDWKVKKINTPRYEYLTRERGKKYVIEPHRSKSRSKVHFERVSVTAFFKRMPRPEIDALELLRQQEASQRMGARAPEPAGPRVDLRGQHNLPPRGDPEQPRQTPVNGVGASSPLRKPAGPPTKPKNARRGAKEGSESSRSSHSSSSSGSESTSSGSSTEFDSRTSRHRGKPGGRNRQRRERSRTREYLIHDENPQSGVSYGHIAASYNLPRQTNLATLQPRTGLPHYDEITEAYKKGRAEGVAARPRELDFTPRIVQDDISFRRIGPSEPRDRFYTDEDFSDEFASMHLDEPYRTREYRIKRKAFQEGRQEGRFEGIEEGSRRYDRPRRMDPWYDSTPDERRPRFDDLAWSERSGRDYRESSRERVRVLEPHYPYRPSERWPRYDRDNRYRR
ncbi:hypothetical protein S40285_00168 [Stachybotrys chlorohalonatus IBT 40285]|uniref:Uncharacterized protein n=1 Tax=Stachybotrys chlorohalonatus (strain IBT 40285) TaxID=1283841 RepID=A0A084QU09_STAC4|nr:hypothetical protein S40285_00168 [Stachybotrys chlorohalonata IBT 40285]